MRMMKRVAVGILTAAMALSMLTACGGGGGNASSGGNSNGSGNGSGSSNSGSSSSSGSTSGGSNNGSSGSTVKDDLTKLPDETEIKYADSQTAKWNRMLNTNGKWYTKTEQISQGKKVIREQAYNGKTRYYKTTYEDGRTFESLYDGTTTYTLYPNVKIATTYVRTGSDSGTTTGETYTLTSVKKTTRVEENVPYYAEVMTYTSKTSQKTITQAYCYDSTGKQVYTVYNVGTKDEYAVHLLSYSSAIPNTAILSIPDDWGIYTMTSDGQFTTITDKDGHELTNEERNAFFDKIYNR